MRNNACKRLTAAKMQKRETLCNLQREKITAKNVLKNKKQLRLKKAEKFRVNLLEIKKNILAVGEED